ncbi:MAG: hypothetical protein QOE00_685, partial [Ilumatobacteraceae bacterium]
AAARMPSHGREPSEPQLVISHRSILPARHVALCHLPSDRGHADAPFWSPGPIGSGRSSAPMFCAPDRHLEALSGADRRLRAPFSRCPRDLGAPRFRLPAAVKEVWRPDRWSRRVRRSDVSRVSRLLGRSDTDQLADERASNGASGCLPDPVELPPSRDSKASRRARCVRAAMRSRPGCSRSECLPNLSASKGNPACRTLVAAPRA